MRVFATHVEPSWRKRFLAMGRRRGIKTAPYAYATDLVYGRCGQSV